MTWRRIDLHLHTPASKDYQEPNVSPLDILKQAEARGLELIAFTDHNSVRGYADLWREIEDLELLEFLKRMTPEEEARLAEYRRLLSGLLLLPGFEFTATFGFHILAIFPEGTSVRLMEHLLLMLGVPEDRFGSGEVGATTDVLRAYEILNEHGALVIGAHVNSAHGIAMQGMRFGGQTKIAYTQDPHLHALEVTDLYIRDRRRSTARFFSGIKAEYPRRMHCIQGSDAHRLERDPNREANLGVGDRATEAFLPSVSFAALKDLFLSESFERTRPYVEYQEPPDLVKEARAEGNTLAQAFHESLATKRSGMSHILKDVVGLANAGGGVIYVGASPFEKRPIVGVKNAEQATSDLHAEIGQAVSPALPVEIDVLESGEKQVLAVKVERGAERPYALAPGSIYVRRDTESTLAERDEIVALVRASAEGGPQQMATDDITSRRNGRTGQAEASDLGQTVPLADQPKAASSRRRRGSPAREAASGSATAAGGTAEMTAQRLDEVVEEAPADDISPQTGVEVLDAFEQDGVKYFTLRDLRHLNFVHNVTADTSRRLWRYAIQQREEKPVDPSHIRWQGDFGFWKSYKPRGGEQRYNLAYRGDGDLRIFYGVNDEGMDDRWRAVLPARRG